MPENIAIRRQIAQELLQGEIDENGFAPCPGKGHHTARSGKRDFRVILEGPPTGTCFHTSCQAEVEAFNLELRRRIGAAESGAVDRPLLQGAVSAKPRSATQRRPAYDPEALADYAGRCPVKVSPEWLIARSPNPLPRASGELSGRFLDALYSHGERLLVFTASFSQGDYIWECGRGGFRLGDRPGVRAVPSILPVGGKEGIWFLTAPVSGEWRPNPNNVDASGNVRLGRRHSACVVRWPYLLLESDDAPADLWLAALVQLPLPIAAAYSSGGRSIHALVRVDAESKAEFDALRDDLMPIVCRIGADAAAMTAVRLSRLPGCMRHGKRAKDGRVKSYSEPQQQRLVWLNPLAPARPILELVPH